jgi:hypothetical protein
MGFIAPAYTPPSGNPPVRFITGGCDNTLLVELQSQRPEIARQHWHSFRKPVIQSEG